MAKYTVNVVSSNDEVGKDMAICKFCGQESGGTKFCQNCGAKPCSPPACTDCKAYTKEGERDYVNAKKLNKWKKLSFLLRI